MIRQLFLLTSIFLIVTSCSLAQVKKVLENTLSAKGEVSPRRQILLTNAAKFSGGRALNGGSGFLITYGGQNYAVTARHLLGEEGGVVPEVKINALKRNLLSWAMSPRIVADAAIETVKLDVNGLDFSKSARDILLLNVSSDTFNLAVLVPNFNLPLAGESLFVVGCPYSETLCKQNFYKVSFVEFDAATAELVCNMDSDVDLSGFSGAPVVNGLNEVVGVLVSGKSSAGRNYVVATHIKEIKKIK